MPHNFAGVMLCQMSASPESSQQEKKTLCYIIFSFLDVAPQPYFFAVNLRVCVHNEIFNSGRNYLASHVGVDKSLLQKNPPPPDEEEEEGIGS